MNFSFTCKHDKHIKQINICEFSSNLYIHKINICKLFMFMGEIHINKSTCTYQHGKHKVIYPTL